jgi:membrane associated rhomboid family serine protease
MTGRLILLAAAAAFLGSGNAFVFNAPMGSLVPLNPAGVRPCAPPRGRWGPVPVCASEVLGCGYGGAGWSGGRGRWWTRGVAGSGETEGPPSEQGDARGLQLLLVRAEEELLVARARARRPTPVTNFFLIANAVIFVINGLFGGGLLEAGAKINTAIVAGGQYYRFFTPMFLHASFMHILVNSFSLYNVGPTVEAYFGHERAAAVYVLAGVAGNVASFLLAPYASSVGASGAIFGLVGALGVFFYRHREVLDTSRPLNSIVQACALNLMFGLLPGSGIDNWGHFGGFLGGAAVAYLVGPNLVPMRSMGGTYLVDRPLLPLFGGDPRARSRARPA